MIALKSSNPKLRKYLYYFGLSMVLVYVFLGLLFIFYDVPIDITENGKIAIGIVLILYGLLRTYSIYRKRKISENEEEQE